MTDNTAISTTPPPAARRRFTCERPGCTDVNGRPELLQRDLAQELVDVGQEPPAPGADRTSGPAPF
ncbi:hypothetical protein [Salinispora cortesiana]|uniref:hypothetical protein n=1 Tax=Salinispora cortesiana TaxID=1305843 RepID=UPI00041A3621|nr:hypothetical protein [Salinispora cortesiana]